MNAIFGADVPTLAINGRLGPAATCGRTYSTRPRRIPSATAAARSDTPSFS